MDKIKNIVIVILITVIVFLSAFIIYFLLLKDNKEDNSIVEIEVDNSTTELTIPTTTQNILYKVDIKGAVANPGVYELGAGSIVNDVIILAGGITKNANTNNINLSQKIYDSMVIYIFTNAELTTTKTTVLNDVKCTTNVIEINNCISTTSKTTTTSKIISKININTASKEELMTLTGIGESKADNIIEYRNKNKFSKIEDIMNISGIGEAAFEKIKDNITV